MHNSSLTKLIFLLALFFAIPTFAFKDSIFHKPEQNKHPEKMSHVPSIKVDRVSRISPYNMQVYDDDIRELYEKSLSHIPMTEVSRRTEIASAYFLGAEYLLNALGEGLHAEFDAQPLYRTDAFDCTTYVSTVLALVHAKNFNDFRKTIRKARYKHGQAVFGSRNHFISADWNPNNQRNGYIKDITHKLTSDYRVATAHINKPAWFRKLKAGNIVLLDSVTNLQALRLLNALSGHAKNTKTVKVEIDYIPLSELFFEKDGKIHPNQKLFNKIPSASVIEIVRANWDLTKQIGTHLNVSHMGFGIRTKNNLIFRQASSVKHKVIDIPLEEYLRKFYNHVEDKTQFGINVQQVINTNHLHDIPPLG